MWREKVGPDPVMMIDDLVRTEMRSVAHRVAVGDRDHFKARLGDTPGPASLAVGKLHEAAGQGRKHNPGATTRHAGPASRQP